MNNTANQTKTQQRGQKSSLSVMPDLQAPYSEEAEEAVIGSILVNPDAFLKCRQLIDPNDFYLIRHGYIWQALNNLSDMGYPVDYVTLSDTLGKMQIGADTALQLIGGPGYITRLVNNTPTSMHAEFYAQIVAAAAIRRRMLAAADEIKALARDESLTSEMIIEEGYTLYRTAVQRQTADHMKPMGYFVNAELDALDAASANAAPRWGLPTGFKTWDQYTGGLLRGLLYIFAGRPQNGKSAVVRQIALNAARAGARVMYVSTEETAQETFNFMLASETGVPPINLLNRDLNQHQIKLIIEAAGRLNRLPIQLNDKFNPTPLSILNDAETMRLETGIDLLCIDYAQEVGRGIPDLKVYDRNTATAVGADTIARKLNIPVVLAAQLNRGVEERKDKRGFPSDIEGSGAYEQKARVITMMYKPGHYDSGHIRPDEIELILRKNKATGVLGTVFTSVNQAARVTESLQQNYTDAPYILTGGG